MAKILITTVPFGDRNRFPLDLLEKANIEYLINPHKTKLTEENFEKLIKSMKGLTTVQAERAIAKIFVRHGKLKDHNIEEALAEKKQIISKTGILEYIEVQETMNDIGGLNSLKQWLEQREVAFSESAKNYGLPTPKGILMIGVQGVGKSLTAKAVSARWNLPLVRLDVGRVFGSLVGESEEKIRRAIKIAEAISPCILWIDELDKAFAGVRGQQGDSGTSAKYLHKYLENGIIDKNLVCSVSIHALYPNDIIKFQKSLTFVHIHERSLTILNIH